MNDENLIINPDVEIPSKEDLKKNLAHYRQTLSYMGANVPIQALCLPKPLEKLLIKAGHLRVYDLINLDLSKIEGIGEGRLDLLTSRLDEFFTIGI